MSDRAISRRAAAGAIIAAPLVARPAFAIDPTLLAAAQREGEVVWYTGLLINQAVRPLAETFQRKHPGVAVRFQQRTSSEVVLAATNEARAGNRIADIVNGGGLMIPALVKAGVIEPYAPPASAPYPGSMKSPDGLWTAITDNYLTTAINTDLVKPDDAPKNYKDLLNPRWRGQILWPDDVSLSGPPGFIGNILLTMGEEAGLDYLRKLSAQKIVKMTGNQRQALDQVIAGNYPIALMTLNHHSVISAEGGAPVRWLKMEPLVQNFGVVSLVKNAPHPNAARLLIDFLISREGQAVLREANYLPAHPDVDAKTPSLKPRAGGFTATALTPEMVDARLDRWIKLYAELFS